MTEFDLVPKRSENAPDPFLNETVQSLVDAMTGLAASDRGELILSASYFLQKFRTIGFLRAVASEWERFAEKGRIKDDYVGTTQHLDCLQELLDFLDQDIPDEQRFEFLKAIFFGAAMEEKTDRDSVLPQQYMALARNLKSGEILGLRGTYGVMKKGFHGQEESAAIWLGQVASESGLRHQSLVENHEEGLISKRLLTPRRHSDRSGVTFGDHYRLTDLAVDLLEFVESYEETA